MNNEISRRELLKLMGIGLTAYLSGMLLNETAYCEIPNGKKELIARRKDELMDKYDKEFSLGKLLSSLEEKTYENYEEISFLSNVNLPQIGGHKIILEHYPASQEVKQKNNENMAITISPLLGNPTFFERGTAKHYAKKGVNAFTINGSGSYLKKIEQQIKDLEADCNITEFSNIWNNIMEQQIIDELQIGEFIKSYKKVERIASVGYGIGGMATLMANTFNKSDVQAFALVGGNIAKIFAYTHYKEIEGKRTEILKKLGKTEAWLENQLREGIL